MASSHVQRECEEWIVQHWLPQQYGVAFAKRKLQMQARGHFEFDAVSVDDRIVANISTATAVTHRNRIAAGKKSKIRADCLMLALVEAQRRVLVLTEPCMFDLTSAEQMNGRLPLNIEIVRAELSPDLSQKLRVARGVASEEVRGGA